MTTRIASFFHAAACLALCLVAATAQAQSSPTAQFVDNGNGTVTHLITGLTWKRCVEGQTWSGSTCQGDDNWTYSFSQATNLSGAFAGKSDWRLPTVWELASIVDYTKFYPQPSINTTVFPNHPYDSYWTNSGNQVSVGAGNVSLSGSFFPARVRMVRGRPASTPLASEFIDNGNGTVTHNRTGLMWKRCLQGKPWTGSTCAGSANFYTFEEGQALSVTFAGYSDWRVANVPEVLSIMNFNSAPLIDPSVMPNVSAQIWTSTQAQTLFVSPNAWYIWTSTGYTNTESTPYTTHPVLMVRGTQRAGVLTRSEINCLFNWGEDNYAHVISPARQITTTGYGYTYRYYPSTNNHVGVSDSDDVLYLRWSSGAMENLGPAAQWVEMAGCR